MKKRSHISLKTKLAACVASMFLTHDEAVLLSEDQVLSLVQWDHTVIPHAEDGPDVFWNLAPMLIGGHRVKTAKVDQPGIAKRKRVSESEQEFRQRLLTKYGQNEHVGLASAITTIQKAAKGSKFPQGRKLQSRNTFQNRRKDK